mmetsp:Transcript_42652/g.37879  ORF Transcript_42652/g.37879 Transcript_42652/m.37879 type:complete len:117 (+) Transcript_42652:111-461(+)|eukprot:CAMPEP_0201565922 /NCGR_PEP_ID=MMETSP0190_2-20130828/5361_1 /ASSEMBLY_ACC=CAM_ASM_000263 /TAXON_ID=37353 /ORGANISM="Rosalina sp." /LENGTH=116 /DNA_ID=CAMNT_0047983979 /DNA_START=105 /DNA_END=455 /DNA_ORIENTATION=+
MAEESTKKQLKSPEEVLGAATNVGGARHKGAKHTGSPKKEDKPKAKDAQPTAVLDKTLQASYNNVQVKGADDQNKGKGSPKLKAQHANAAQKAPPVKNINGKKQNNPKINQPKQGY